MSITPFNPLDKRALARAVAKAMLERPAVPLPPEEPFSGAGIYAIYYSGRFPPYERISAMNRQHRSALPIFVGKAAPKGARKGGFELGKAAGSVLYNRLREHAESINQVANLDLSDFACRYLVVDDIWIPLGEQLLIQAFAPLWNAVVNGFGNHDPGAGRRRQQRSRWDVLHPGRPWAKKQELNKRTEAQILAEIRGFLASWEVKQP